MYTSESSWKLWQPVLVVTGINDVLTGWLATLTGQCDGWQQVNFDLGNRGRQIQHPVNHSLIKE